MGIIPTVDRAVSVVLKPIVTTEDASVGPA